MKCKKKYPFYVFEAYTCRKHWSGKDSRNKASSPHSHIQTRSNSSSVLTNVGGHAAPVFWEGASQVFQGSFLRFTTNKIVLSNLAFAFNPSVGSFCMLVPVQTWMSGLLGRHSSPQNSGHLIHIAKIGGESPYVDLGLREASPEDNSEHLS